RHRLGDAHRARGAPPRRAAARGGAGGAGTAADDPWASPDGGDRKPLPGQRDGAGEPGGIPAQRAAGDARRGQRSRGPGAGALAEGHRRADRPASGGGAMTRFRTLTGMALHELWISFRLIPLLGLPVVGGLLISAIPPEYAGETAVGGAGFWFAVIAAVATCLAAGLAALTMAHERHRGTVAWMAARAVPRAAVLFSWFLAFAILLILGLAIASVGAWLA